MVGWLVLRFRHMLALEYVGYVGLSNDEETGCYMQS